MTILVTGATGAVGRHVVAGLVSAGADVRALTREAAKAQTQLPDGVQVFEGDLTRTESLVPALDGVDALYLFPVPETVHEVVEQAVAAGVRKVVVLSSSSVLDTSGDNHSGEYHRTVERAVEASGLEWTFVRPDEFATNILWKWGHSIRTEDVVRAPYGAAPRVLIHEADVAAVAVAALLGDGHTGEAYVVTGPEAITQADQVTAIAAAVGRDVAFEEITPGEARAQMGQFMPEPVVEMVLGYLADAIAHPPVPVDTVERVTGRPARTFAQWAADHAADFAPQPAQETAPQTVQERNKQIALDCAAAWNRWELDGILKHWSPDIRHFSEDRPVDTQQMIGAMKGGLAAFPDLHLDVKSAVSEGDRVILRISVTATHLGEFMGKAPTGKKVSWYMLEELRFNDEGKIIEHYDVFNYLPMLKELGFVAADVL